MAGKVVIKGGQDGDAFWMLGGLYEVKVSSDDSNGMQTVMQFTIPEGMGPPPHIHNCDETVAILDGMARFRVDGSEIELGPGSVTYFPAGTMETFEPIGQVRLLATYAPGGIDKFFAEAGEPATIRDVPPAPSAPPDLELLATIAARHGLELLAPSGR